MALTAYRMNELERKMLEAAGRQDYEAAITLRDELKALRQAHADAEPPPPPKVVDIFTRSEVTATPKGRRKKRKEEPYVDQDALSLLSDVMGEVQAGRAVGVCVLVGRLGPEGYMYEIEPFISGHALDYTRLFVGGAQTLSHDLLSIEADAFDEEFDEE